MVEATGTALVGPAFEGADAVGKAEMLGGHEDALGAAGGGGHGADLPGGDGEGFFAEDVESGAEGGEDGGGVGFVGGADVHAIEGFGQQAAVVGEDFGDVEIAGERFGGIAADITDGGQCDAGDGVPTGIEVGGAHDAAGADEADAEGAGGG